MYYMIFISHFQATLLLTYPFNHGALIAAAHLISDKDTSLHDAAGVCLYACVIIVYMYYVHVCTLYM